MSVSPVVSLDAIPLVPVAAQRPQLQRRALTRSAGGQALGCSAYVLAPGAMSWPFHYHAANEEALFILAGEGELRLGDDRWPLRARDYVALPAGPAHAHQLCNTGTLPLEYLCMSTMVPVDVTVYPDSDKLAVFAGSAPGGHAGARFMAGNWRRRDAVDYWEDEA